MSSSNRRNSPLFWGPAPTEADAAPTPDAAPAPPPAAPPPPAADQEPSAPAPSATSPDAPTMAPPPPVAAPPPPPRPAPEPPTPALVEDVQVETAPAPVEEEPAAEEAQAPADFDAPAALDAPKEHAFSPSSPPGFEEDGPDEELPSIEAIKPFIDPPPPDADPLFDQETIAGTDSLFDDDDPAFIDSPYESSNMDTPTEEMSRDQLFSDDAELAFGLSDDAPASINDESALEDETSGFDADLFDVDSFDDDADDEWSLKDPKAGKKRIGLALAALLIGGAFWWVSQQQPEDGTLDDQIEAAEQEAAEQEAIKEQVIADLAEKKDAEAKGTDAEEPEAAAPEEAAAAEEAAKPAPKAATKPATKPKLSGTKKTPPPPPPEALKPKPRQSRPTANKLVNAGWTAIGEGKFGVARQKFIDAVGLEPRNAMAHYGLGYAADKQGDDEAALNYFCKAQTLTGGAGEVAREVEGILARKGWTCS